MTLRITLYFPNRYEVIVRNVFIISRRNTLPYSSIYTRVTNVRENIATSSFGQLIHIICIDILLVISAPNHSNAYYI